MKKFLLLILLALSCNCFAHETTVVLLTGLPCAGKTTIANGLHDLFPESVVIDGDVVRSTINKDLGFTKEDREENLRRVIEMTKMVSHSTPLVFLAFVSPYDSIRQEMKDEIEGAGMTFCEVFVHAPLETCIERDCKGMYAKGLRRKSRSASACSREKQRRGVLVCKRAQRDG